MTKVKISYTVEFDVNPDNYDEGSTPEQMLDIELEDINNDPYTFIEIFPDGVFKGEVIS